MTAWKLSYAVHVSLWVLLCLISLFTNIGVPILIAFLFFVGFLYSVPLRVLGKVDIPLTTMFNASPIKETAIIVWTVIVILIAVFIIFKAVKRWKEGKKTPVRVLLHVMVFVVGAFSIGFVGSINFPLVL